MPAGNATGIETFEKAGYYAEEGYFWGTLALNVRDSYTLGTQLDQQAQDVLTSSITDVQKQKVVKHGLGMTETVFHEAIDPRY